MLFPYFVIVRNYISYEFSYELLIFGLG